jgi:TRAP-type transport system periplasmic protein
MRTPRNLTPLLVIIGVVTLLTAGLLQQRADAQDAEFTLKFATVAPQGTPWTDQLTAVKKRVETESGGRIKFKLYPSGNLGGEVETVRKCQRNQIQGWGGSTAAIAEGMGLPQFQVFELPFLFDSTPEADYVLDEHLFEPMSQLLDGAGFHMAWWHENGWHNFATKNKVVHTPDDLREMKMRSQESPVHLAMFKALGVQALSMPVPEVLGALQTNMVDGFSNTPLFTGATGWYEGIEYYTITHHIYQPAAIIYNKEFMDSLPEDLQQIVVGDRQAETEHGRATVRALTPELLAMFRDEGITVYEMTPEERAAFEVLCQDVPTQFHDSIGRSLINTVKAAQKMYRAQHGG